jgi:hypothetical protein
MARSGHGRDSFRTKMMRRFLLDATICAIKNVERSSELPKPKGARIFVDDNVMEFGRSNPKSVTNKLGNNFTAAIPAKGLFANLKKPKAVVLRPRDRQKEAFNEECLFSSAESRHSKHFKHSTHSARSTHSSHSTKIQSKRQDSLELCHSSPLSNQNANVPIKDHISETKTSLLGQKPESNFPMIFEGDSAASLDLDILSSNGYHLVSAD